MTHTAMRDHRPPRRNQRSTGHPHRPGRAPHPGHPGGPDSPGRPDRPDEGRARPDPYGKPAKPFKPDRPHGKPTPTDRDRDAGTGRRDHRAGGAKRPSRPWRAAVRLRDGRVVLYGWHTVKAALENPARKIHRLLASETAARRMAQEVELTLPPEIVRNDALDALAGADAVHQGVVAEADALDSPAIEDLAPEGLVLVLDQITDPHNVGAILRTAAAFAVEAVVTTERHSPEATGVLAKAASGALEYVPLVTVVNLARGLEALKNQDVLLVGLDSSGTGDLAAMPLRAPLALVLGAEGKGLRHLTRQNCDVIARLDLPGRIKSLNVSNATALALHVASTRLRGG